MAIPKPLLPTLLIITINITSFTQLSIAAKQPASSVNWAKTINSGKEKITTLQFYYHDVVSSKDSTAVQLIPPSNVTNASKTGFGALVMMDEQLTVGPEPTSKEVGRAQGMFGGADKDEVGLIMALSYYFTDGVYNGSWISILGRNSASVEVHEMPVVGGTGVFRMAKGYALLHSIKRDPKTRVGLVGYNVTVIH